jgi:uncharacterized membrane protein
MTKKQAHSHQTIEQSKQIILETIKKQTPESTQQLVYLVKGKTPLSIKELTQLLIQLESENKVHFAEKETMMPSTITTNVFSKQKAWYWITDVLALTTVITVLTIPDNAYPLSYLRSVLGLVFALFLPGFAFVKMLFPSKLPVSTSGEDMDIIVRVALSFGLSLVLVPMVGLVFYYTPYGLGIVPITLSLLVLTVIFATVALLREISNQN